MADLHLDEHFTHQDEMREGSIQKRNTLMHRQLKSFEESLRAATEYYNPDDLYNLIVPIVPPGVHIVSFDGLQRIVGQSKLSKGGRKVNAQPTLYFRAFLQDFLQYLDHLQQLKDNFDARIYAILFEYYYKMVLEDLGLSDRQTEEQLNFTKILQLPKYSQLQKKPSEELVEELSADWEMLSEVMTSLQVVVRRWGRLLEEEDIDPLLLDAESRIDLDAYPNCDSFQEIFRFVPDVLHKGKVGHTLAYEWWCLAEKIRKKLTGQWKPKETTPQKTIQVKTVGGAKIDSPIEESRGKTSANKAAVSSVASVHYEGCTDSKKDNKWVQAARKNAKMTKKEPSGPRRRSGIPRRVVVKQKRENGTKGGPQRAQKQTQKLRDVSTSPMNTLEELNTKNIRQDEEGVNPTERHKYSYSDSEFEEDDSGAEEKPSGMQGGHLHEKWQRGGHLHEHQQRLMMPEKENWPDHFVHTQRRTENPEGQVGTLTYDIDLKVRKLEEKVKELVGADSHQTHPQRLSEQVSRAIRDIESLQDGLQEIEIEKEQLRRRLQNPRRDAVSEDRLKEDIVAMNRKLEDMAGLARVNTYRHQLISSDVDLALELRGTFTRYNQEVKDKIAILERLIEAERQEQAKLEMEIAEMESQTHENVKGTLYLQSITPTDVTPNGGGRVLGRHDTPKGSLPALEGEVYDREIADHTYGDLELDLDSDGSSSDSDEDETDAFLSGTTNDKAELPLVGHGEGRIAENKETAVQKSNRKSVTRKSRIPQRAPREQAPLDPLREGPSTQGSVERGSSSTREGLDSPSPRMYQSKRDNLISLDLEPLLRMPRMKENSN